ncbi:MBL fold metallo-hydrolase [Heliobacterium gestii]|uniref:MBL fold metallo-hydrolase n=1 Tax=Heliomicrobium gestii TaxID=2699 RepID=A0A845LGT0_HELGE|nr:MBL fold metallo-hydrolase [Heliomicrobium gestii]MBM7867369.1 glyoxylase-like metal-dependent hydrolase (beta-lactamase superfamily II) [Heliomicrobium gestii]MZP43635.1 MBL fold metallo-hydrolase [Heliomicrobium gestii]
MARIIPLQIPTDYPVGDVIAYLIDDKKKVLIDTGPPSPKAMTCLRQQLSAAGCELRDLDDIIITHYHIDHFGLAHLLYEEAQIAITMHSLDHYSFTTEQTVAKMLMQGWALPTDMVQKMERSAKGIFIPEAYRRKDVQYKWIQEEERLDTGEFQFQIIHTPGHSLGHVALWEAKQGWLLSGDLLLQQIVPNPYLSQVAGQRIRTLPLFFNSLDKIDAVGPKICFPSHGPSFHYDREIVQRLKRHFIDKALAVFEILHERKQADLITLAQALYPKEILRDGFGVFSKVIGCLDLLEELGLIQYEKGTVHPVIQNTGWARQRLVERHGLDKSAHGAGLAGRFTGSAISGQQRT